MMTLDSTAVRKTVIWMIRFGLYHWKSFVWVIKIAAEKSPFKNKILPANFHVLRHHNFFHVASEANPQKSLCWHRCTKKTIHWIENLLHIIEKVIAQSKWPLQQTKSSSLQNNMHATWPNTICTAQSTVSIGLLYVGDTATSGWLAGWPNTGQCNILTGK